MRVTTAPKLKNPDCKGESYYVLPLGEDVNRDTYVVAKIIAFPSFSDRGINEYYRVSQLWVSYKKISIDSQKKLNQDIFGRTGVKGEQDPIFGGLVTPGNFKTDFGGLKLTRIKVNAEEDHLSLIADFGNGIFETAYKAQKGCTSAAPKL